MGYLLALAVLLVLFALHLTTGPVELPVAAVLRALLPGADADTMVAALVWGVRLPEAITAMAVGGSLAIGGALLQTLFTNPLAGPSVLGISSGASLGVAIASLGSGISVFGWLGHDSALVLAAFLGSMAVLVIIGLADGRLGGGAILLIVGLMLGHACSAIISVLEVAAGERALRGFVLWGMGSFSTVGPDRLGLLLPPLVLGSIGAMLLVKPLNALLLGEVYARSMGTDVTLIRRMVLVITGLLTATCTAFCGPIAFLGLATPHLARGLLGTSDHRHVLPASLIMGAIIALACDLVVRWSALRMALPLNAVTAFVGVPVVIWILLRGRRWMLTP